jgi:hypothetical protein
LEAQENLSLQVELHGEKALLSLLSVMDSEVCFELALGGIR